MLVVIILVAVIIVFIRLIARTPKADAYVSVKSRQTLEKYDVIRFFKENSEKLTEAEKIIKEKKEKKGSSEGTYLIRVQ